MSEFRRTEGGLIINRPNSLVLLTLDPDDHGLELPEVNDLGDDAIEACQSGDLFFKRDGGVILALALSPRSVSDRLHIFPEADMWRTYLEYWLFTGEGRISIVVSHYARLAIEQAGVTTSNRTGISQEELDLTDEQYERMLDRQAEARAAEELSGLDFGDFLEDPLGYGKEGGRD